MWRVFAYCLLVGVPLTWANVRAVALEFNAGQTESGLRYVLVSGDFEPQDNLASFSALVGTSGAVVAVFNSGGGNVTKAIELGRLIRVLGMGTLQIRSTECASACALAFLGGVLRYAEPGSIGVHKSSFSPDFSITTAEAVSAVQEMTAEIMAYIAEMGSDPALLQLAFRYDSDDMRYLSMSEMKQYRVVTETQASASEAPPTPTATGPDIPPAQSSASAAPIPQDTLQAPRALTGRVRHPKSSAPLKAAADGKSANLLTLGNGTNVEILGNSERWYRVRIGDKIGYMHDTWVFVDQYNSGPFEQRHIQIKSFDNLSDAETFVKTASIPLSAYLVTNGWFAITLRETYSQDTAKNLVVEMKSRGTIPDDSYVSFGNTYVRKVCCN